MPVDRKRLGGAGTFKPGEAGSWKLTKISRGDNTVGMPISQQPHPEQPRVDESSALTSRVRQAGA